MNDVAQISFVPFLLPGSIQPKHIQKTCEDIAAEADSTVVRLSMVERSLLGPGAAKLYTEIGSVPMNVFILSPGVGVFVIDWPADDLGNEPRHFLTLRRQRHDGVINVSSNEGAKCLAVANALQRSVRPEIQFPTSVFRTETPFSYVFSMWEIRYSGNDSNNPAQSIERALLFPSAFGLSDTQWETQQVASDTIEEQVLPPDVEPHSASHCRMTWASVVVSGDIKDRDRHVYRSLEVRAQALWLFAHRVCCIAPSLRRPAAGEATLLSASFEHASRGLFQVIDPTASSRIQEIHREIVRTSGLDDQVEQARGNLTTLKGISSATETRARSRFEWAMAALLYLIACLQEI